MLAELIIDITKEFELDLGAGRGVFIAGVEVLQRDLQLTLYEVIQDVMRLGRPVFDGQVDGAGSHFSLDLTLVTRMASP